MDSEEDRIHSLSPVYGAPATCKHCSAGWGQRRSQAGCPCPFGGDFPRRGSFPDITSELRPSGGCRAGPGKRTARAGAGCAEWERWGWRNPRRGQEAASHGIRGGLECREHLERQDHRDSPAGPWTSPDLKPDSSRFQAHRHHPGAEGPRASRAVSDSASAKQG